MKPLTHLLCSCPTARCERGRAISRPTITFQPQPPRELNKWSFNLIVTNRQKSEPNRIISRRNIHLTFFAMRPTARGERGRWRPRSFVFALTDIVQCMLVCKMKYEDQCNRNRRRNQMINRKFYKNLFKMIISAILYFSLHDYDNGSKFDLVLDFWPLAPGYFEPVITK